tara:strand:- start:361 stop:1239 length:879 start_codon:yes stop_codon:yes gene_type:complete
MAETFTIDNAPEAEVLTEEEQDSLQVGEKLVAEQEGLLAGKYENPEQLEKAYLELQQKLGDNTDGVQEGREETQEVESTEDKTETTVQEYLEDGSVNYDLVSESYGSEVSSVLQNKGVDPFAISKHFHANDGNITDEHYAQLQEAGFSKQIVDSYLQGRKTESGYQKAEIVDMSDTDVRTIQNLAGGQKDYAKLVTWASENLDNKDIQAFDDLVNSGNVDQIKLAVTGMKAQFQEANGYEGRMLTGKPSKTADSVFRSQAELVAAMSDPRYDTDPAYRQDVIAKLDRSDVNF